MTYISMTQIYCLECGEAEKVSVGYLKEMKKVGNVHCGHCHGPAIEITEEDWKSRIHIGRNFPG